MWQSLVVAVLVTGCGIYAAWTLFPKKLRSRVAQVLLRLQPTGWLKETLTQAANVQGGCGCSGCDRSPIAQKQVTFDTQSMSGFQSITFVRGISRKKF